MKKIAQFLIKATLQEENERQHLNKLKSVGDKYNRLFHDEYWQGPNQAIKDLGKINKSISIVESFYDKNFPHKAKTWILAGAFIDQKTQKKRGLWIMIKAHGAGTDKDPLESYDMTVQVEVLNPEKMQDKAKSYVKSL